MPAWEDQSVTTTNDPFDVYREGAGGKCGKNEDTLLSCQPCGCDPSHRNGVYMGYYCSNYPTCAYGKQEAILGLRRAIETSAAQVLGVKTLDTPKGIGGAPTRATILPETATGRKTYPVATGCLDYFPDALAAISHLSWKGNEQHNPGQPLHWNRSKSGDEADTLMRHFLQRGTLDSDGVRHSVKVAWRALALLQKELEGVSYPAPTVITSKGSASQRYEEGD